MSLPSGYKELTYIESNGTQYIDTNVLVDSNYRIQTEFFVVGDCTPYAAYISGSMIAINIEDEVACYYGSHAAETTKSANNIYTVDQDKNVFLINDTTVIVTPETFTAIQDTLKLCQGDCRMSMFKVWRGDGVQLRDYVPAKRVSDNAIGMYDLITEEFYENAGTGEFIAGQVISNILNTTTEVLHTNGRTVIPGYTVLDSIASTGTQYINTGVYGEARLVGTAQATQANTYSVLGDYSGSGATGKALAVYASNYYWGIASGTGLTNIKGTTQVDFDINFGQSTASGTIGGKTVTATPSGPYYANQWVLFSCVDAGVFGKMRVSRLQMYQNGVMVRNFVPVRPDNDTRVGLYDTVEGKFYTNDNPNSSDPFIAGAEKYHDLPSGYTELEWIQSSGTQYIDTGIESNSNIDVEVDVMTPAISSTNSTTVIVGRTTSTEDKIGIYYGVNNNAFYSKPQYGTQLSSENVGIEYMIPSTFQKVRLNKNVYSIDGHIVYTFNVETFSSLYTLYLFGQNTGGTISTNSKHKIKGCIIRNDTTTVRNFVPARNSSNVIGMYDLVSNTFFTNSGTGTFTAGPEVTFDGDITSYGCGICGGGILPQGYEELEYITAATAGPYIQLNSEFLDTDEVEIKTKLGSTGADKYLVSPTTWNNNSNRFAMGGTFDTSNRCVGFGGRGTGQTKYTPAVTPEIGQITIEKYADKLFTITGSGINSSVDVSTLSFGGETDNLKLFYGYNSATAGTIYYWKHKKVVDGTLTLVENLVPAQRTSDSVVGMYDTVTNTFFTNAGSGSFTAGPTIYHTPTSYNSILITED